jgi:hypothetical protein
MKKLLILLLSVAFIGTATAQAKKETKVKKTTTVGQKVHNVFSKHKHYSGTKVKKVTKKD